MTRIGSAAEQFALQQVGTTIKAGMCLSNVAYWFDVPHNTLTATRAWNNTRRHTGLPPAGSVVPAWFQSSNPAGHVAMMLHDFSLVSVNGTKVSHFANYQAMAGFGTYMGWGESLNGVTLWTPPPAYSNIVPFQKAIRATPDNVWGPDTQKRWEAVYYASNYGGNRFPWGVAYTQSVVGAVQDGKWGPNSMAAHDATVVNVQHVVGAAPDGIVGPDTVGKVNALHASSNHTV